MTNQNTYEPVLSKRDFCRRFKAGEFGNASPTWDTLKELIASGWLEREDQLFHLRNRTAGGPTLYNLNKSELPLSWETVVNPKNWYCSAMAPTDKTVLQGEIIKSSQCNPSGHYPLWFTGSEVKKPMREALTEDSFTLQGLSVIMYLKYRMNWRSWEWLEHLLETYPDHVVELSVYSRCWGTIPGFNVVFWECRHY